jgi:beta-N-acetylhexosaminidase
LRTAGVLGCGKHFPGLGGASADTHFHLPAIQRSPAQIWKEDVEPYRRLRRQLPMIMVGHASYPACGDPRPASISRYWINKILRGKIGYRGLVVSDDLEMGAVAAAGSIEETSVAAISAGADLALICHQEELLRRGWEAIMRAAEADARFRRRLRQSAGRVTKFKQRHPELRRFPPAPRPARIARLRAQLLEFAQLVEPQPLAASPA